MRSSLDEAVNSNHAQFWKVSIDAELADKMTKDT